MLELITVIINVVIFLAIWLMSRRIDKQIKELDTAIDNLLNQKKL